jgi:NitT/TauT family transport system substrate-binding protein
MFEYIVETARASLMQRFELPSMLHSRSSPDPASNRSGLPFWASFGAANAKADRIRVAVQKTGTLAWELDVIKRHGIERKLDLIIDTLELASTEAGKVALKGGSVDLILSDWLWVARERSLGDTLVFYPASTALGAVMTPAQSSIRSVLDLKDKKLAIAGGPLDKSWLLLQAFALRAGIDLRKQAVIVYGAPPLLSQKALQGETDATLTYWNFCAELENRGFSRAIAMENVIRGLGAKGPVAIVGYAFDGNWASRNTSTVERFLAAVHQAKEILAGSETEWQRLAANLSLSDANAVAIYRQRYSEGVLRRPLSEEEADARALYLVLADIGGTQLVGAARVLPPGTFYRPAAE